MNEDGAHGGSLSLRGLPRVPSGVGWNLTLPVPQGSDHPFVLIILAEYPSSWIARMMRSGVTIFGS